MLIVLGMSIFPLIVSLHLSLSRFKLAKGGFTVDLIGTLNFEKLLLGSQQFHLLGKLVRCRRSPGPASGWSRSRPCGRPGRGCGAAPAPASSSGGW